MTRQNSGVGWVLMADEESVDKAINYYMSGEVIYKFNDHLKPPTLLLIETFQHNTRKSAF